MKVIIFVIYHYSKLINIELIAGYVIIEDAWPLAICKRGLGFNLFYVVYVACGCTKDTVELLVGCRMLVCFNV